MQKHFGDTTGIGLQCLRVVEIKKLEKGSWYFEATLQGMTYSGVHNPPYYIVTVNVVKETETNGKWELKDYTVRDWNPNPNEKRECRRPA